MPSADGFLEASMVVEDFCCEICIQLLAFIKKILKILRGITVYAGAGRDAVAHFFRVLVKLSRNFFCITSISLERSLFFLIW